MLMLEQAFLEEWAGCISAGEMFADWSGCIDPDMTISSRKSVRFSYPVVTERRYRPRETREECSRLYFTDKEMKAMRRKQEILLMEEESDRIKEDMARMCALNPKFETVHQPGNNVKVMCKCGAIS